MLRRRFDNRKDIQPCPVKAICAQGSGKIRSNGLLDNSNRKTFSARQKNDWNEKPGEPFANKCSQEVDELSSWSIL